MNPTDTVTINPVKPEKRILSLDVLRGLAVLAILIMNIQSFAMIEAAYINPTAYGNLTGLNLLTWKFDYIFADQKFFSIFSMLFGVSILIFSHNVDKKGGNAVRLFYIRMAWLFLFGMVHGYLLWHGDVLVAYALCGAFVFLLRDFSPRTLIVAGLVVIAVPCINYWIFGQSIEFWPWAEAKGLINLWKPDAQTIGQEVAALRGGFIEQLEWRFAAAWHRQSFTFQAWTVWKAAGLMMLGMALYKLKIINGIKSGKFYLVAALVMLIPGVYLQIEGIHKNFAAAWSMDYSMLYGWQWNYTGSIFMALGYVSLLLFFLKLNLFQRLFNLLADIGKMAFSNYILMTLVCTFIFYGHGLGLFGKVDRVHQLLVVLGVWIIVVIFSRIWLRNYRFGPLEWLWRTLTYGHRIRNKVKTRLV